MDYGASFQISASGMALEKLRLDVTVANLANLHSAANSDAGVYQPLRVIGQTVPLSFAQQYGQLSLQSGGGVQVQSVASSYAAPRLVYEPGHPQADDKGFVHYPGINHTSEMVNVLSALRAYEANLVALGAAKTMATRTLEIGGTQ
jgi:flagellar basal-body rod protein FlgC